jgi:hypothetical protein
MLDTILAVFQYAQLAIDGATLLLTVGGILVGVVRLLS